MSKRVSERTHQKSNGSLRVRWVEVELSGADTTIEEALRTVERMRRPVVIDAPPSPKRVGHNGKPVNGESEKSDASMPFENRDDIDSEAVCTELDPDATSDDADEVDLPPKKRGAGNRKDYNARIKPVGNVDFVPDGKQSLKEFFAAKAPSSHMDQILVLCYFLKHVVECVQIGPGHVLSGFKHVCKPVPKDLKQTIRNMKSEKAWLNFNDIEDIVLTTEGDNRVEHQLGNGGADV